MCSQSAVWLANKSKLFQIFGNPVIRMFANVVFYCYIVKDLALLSCKICIKQLVYVCTSYLG